MVPCMRHTQSLLIYFNFTDDTIYSVLQKPQPFRNNKLKLKKKNNKAKTKMEKLLKDAIKQVF